MTTVLLASKIVHQSLRMTEVEVYVCELASMEALVQPLYHLKVVCVCACVWDGGA